MALSTTTPPCAASSDPGTRRIGATGHDLAALVCAVSAGVHGALVAPHFGESTAMGAAFAVSTVALALAALGEALEAGPAVSVAVAVLLVGTAVAYLLSRTTGIPGLTEHPETFDTLGTAVSVLEVAGAALAVVHLNPRRNR
jgi:hypothetical protein